MDQAKISICVTSYNRADVTIRSFHKVLDHPAVGEVVIADDCSDMNIYAELSEMVDDINNRGKIRLYRNEANLDCYRNKFEVIRSASNEWVIILDSDNEIDVRFIDTIYERTFLKNLIYQPSFAKPHFDFRDLGGEVITKGNIGHIIKTYPCAETMLNAMNYFVNRSEYIRVFDDKVDPVTADSIYQNYNWLKAGNGIMVVPGLSYEHPISKDSHYKANIKRTPSGFYESVVDKLKMLK